MELNEQEKMFIMERFAEFESEHNASHTSKLIIKNIIEKFNNE